MYKPTPLPDPLPKKPFTVREALELGVKPGRLRAQDLDRSVWGVRGMATEAAIVSPAVAQGHTQTPFGAAGADSVHARCRLLALRMPSAAFFSHATAALIHKIPLPWHVERSHSFHISVPAPARAPHAAGIIGHRLKITPAELQVVNGLSVTTPERTWCDLASMLRVHDLVAAGDYLIHHKLAVTSSRKLRRAVENRVGRRGMVALSLALGLLSEYSESPPESVLRVIVILAGLPEPEVQHNVTTAFGEFVARTDLLIREYRIVLEYMGDYHRTTKGQWRADMTRRSKLESQGWRVMEINADDLRDPDELVERIRRLARNAQPASL